MKELTRHIEILLLHNDCVIVPDLGGFITHHVSARIDKTGNMFVPPQRTLGFNSLLTMSDSLLAESYMEAYDLSFPEAMKRIQHEVEQFKQHLEREGLLKIGDLGLLSITKDGHYEFTPSHEGIMSPRLYGLGIFELPTTSMESKQQTMSKASHVMMPLQPQSSSTSQHSLATIMSHLDNNNHSEEKTISIKVSVLRNMAVTAVAAIALVLFARPVPPNESMEQEKTVTEAGMMALPGSVASQETTTDIEMAIPEAESNVMKNLQELAQMIKDSKEKDMAPTAGNYTIVLGCSLPLENAKSYLSQVHEKGIKKAVLIEYHSDNMIVYGNYSSSNDALSQLKEFAQQGLSGWIMEVKP